MVVGVDKYIISFVNLNVLWFKNDTHIHARP